MDQNQIHKKNVFHWLCVFSEIQKNTKIRSPYVFAEFHLFLLFMFELLQAKWTQTFFESFVYF